MMSVKKILQVLLFGLIATLTIQSLQGQEMREWTSADGKRKIQASFLGFDGDMIKIRFANGKTQTVTPDRFSVADRKYLSQLKAATINDGKETAENQTTKEDKKSRKDFQNAERNLMLASEVLTFYKRAKQWDEIAPTDQAFVDSRIETFQILADENAFNLEGNFVREQDWQERRKAGERMVSDWVVSAQSIGGKQKTARLKSATQADPVALQAAILEGLYSYFYERDTKKSLKYLKDAIRRGERYALLRTDADTTNLICALENAAVVSITENRIGKAFDYWQRAIELADRESNELRSNLARTSEFVKRKSIGVSASKSELKKIALLSDELKVRATADEGWKFTFPNNTAGKKYTSLDFLVPDDAKKFAEVESDGIEDFLCLICTGLGHMKCPNKRCNGGGVIEKFMVLQQTQYGVQKVEKAKTVTCPRCSGKSKVGCWGCQSHGVQGESRSGSNRFKRKDK